MYLYYSSAPVEAPTTVFGGGGGGVGVAARVKPIAADE